MRRSAYIREILRSVRGSLGRFLAIMGIVALGCGFYAGLRMCGPDMRRAGDLWYDGTALWDLRVISTLGFSDDDIETLSSVEGVDAAMPSYTIDAMAEIGDGQVSVRISSIDAAAAGACTYASPFTVVSQDGDYLNRVQLVSGRWPTRAGECVASADAAGVDARVGDTVTVLSSTSDVDTLLSETRLEVVGLVTSSNYPYTGSFGSTTLGSGTVDQYFYITADGFSDDLPYTEAYLTVSGAASYESGSAAYEEAVGVVKERIEAEAGTLAASRQETLRADAQEALDEKKDEYWAEHDSAYGELEEARRELDDAAAQLAEGEGQLAQGEAEYREGLEEYESQKAEAERQLDAAQAELSRSRQQLEAGEDAYDDGLAQLLSATGTESLDEADASLAARQQQIADARQQRAELAGQLDEANEAVSHKAGVEAGITQAQAGLGQAQAAVDALEAQKQQRLDAGLEWTDGEEAQLEAARSSRDEAQETLNGLLAQQAAIAQAEAAIPQLEAGIAAIDAALPSHEEEESLASARQSVSDLRATRQQLDEGWASLAAGEQELAEARSQADARLSQARAQLDAAAATLASSRAQLAEARGQYEDGLRSYEDGLAEADERFDEAWGQIMDAQDEIDSVELPDIYTLDRTQSEGAATYEADTERMDNIAAVFPAIFFLVAALVALTTMTRMVEDDRVQIGTYKALGYGTAQIAAKYLVYALVASGIGAVAGIALLSQVLPYIVINAYSIIYAVPQMALPYPVDPGIALSAGGLGVGVTLVATWLAVVSSLRATPAALMLPRAPKAGKRILLEHLGPLWRRFSFSWKVTCRNLFRYKRRLFMTIVGIAGCTALLLVGFGLHDSIWDIIDRQYGPIIHYNTMIGLDGDANELDVARVIDYLEETGDVDGIVRVQLENMQARGTGASTSATGTTRVSVVIPRDEAGFDQAVSFRERVGGKDVAFDGSSVLITEKLASLYNVGVGDTIVLYQQDSVGNAQGGGVGLTVSGVVENYVGNLVYVGRDAWEQVREDLDEKAPVFSTLYATTAGDEAVHARLSDGLHTLPDVSTVLFSDETINTYRHMLTVVDMIVVVLTVSAGALAFIVLYNLTNINISERVREIASLRVLGFTRHEVHLYVFREIVVLSLLGDVVGMFLGTRLATFVITTAEVDYVMFGREIHPASYAYAFGLTIAFTLLILLLMRRKLDQVNMVESLKSVD